MYQILRKLNPSAEILGAKSGSFKKNLRSQTPTLGSNVTTVSPGLTHLYAITVQIWIYKQKQSTNSIDKTLFAAWFVDKNLQKIRKLLNTVDFTVGQTQFTMSKFSTNDAIFQCHFELNYP